MRKYLIAFATFVLFVAMLISLDFVMAQRAEFYINNGVEVPLSERILFGIAAFWRHFWWFVTPALFLACSFVTGLVHLFLNSRAKAVDQALR